MTTIMLIASEPLQISLSPEYMIGGIISVFILGYLVYTLVKPEKF